MTSMDEQFASLMKDGRQQIDALKSNYESDLLKTRTQLENDHRYKSMLSAKILKPSSKLKLQR